MRVRRSTRDRVAALGARTHEPADAVVDKAVALYEKELFWAEWDRAQQSTTAEDRAAEADEMAAWDRASTADLRARDRADRAHG